MKIFVIGAGIIGTLSALELAKRGADVTVIDAAGPATQASGASFGWINASFHADDAHFHLRYAAMAAHRRLAQALGTSAIKWQGCLCWEEQGDAFDAQYENLLRLGYPVSVVGKPTFEGLEPSIEAPDKALLFHDEGAVDLPHLTQDSLEAAFSLGVKLISGVAVEGIETRNNTCVGVRWSGGVLACDKVVVAAGTQTEKLLSGVDVTVPMLDRPGLILRSAPLPPMLAHILVSPDQEVRQDPSGRLLAPTAASHQSDNASAITEDPTVLAQTAAKRLETMLRCEVSWEHVMRADRPVPQDGLPVMGECGPQGVYVATMHSGATLAALAAEIIAAEVMEAPLSNAQAALIAPYRPDRFTK